MNKTKELHERIFYPVARVRIGKANGSGTVVYSEVTEATKDLEEYKQEYETYLLTNYHVVSDAIQVEKEYVAKIGRERKEETRAKVLVEFFNREYLSRHTGTTGIDADIVAWHQKHDLALIKLRSVSKVPFVARWYRGARDESGKVKTVFIFDETYVVGAAMGDPPIQTHGQIASLDKEIENYSYWIQTAPTIFGNSGGAVFLTKAMEYIGIPAMIGVVMIGFGGSAITHMSYIIPIDRIEQWLKYEHFEFIFDRSMTPSSCEKARKAEKDAERQLLFSEQKEEAVS